MTDVRDALRRRDATAYAQGFRDGISELVDQLRDRSDIAPQGGYRGPVPVELDEWLDQVSVRLERL